jgi:hypothetical protein
MVDNYLRREGLLLLEFKLQQSLEAFKGEAIAFSKEQRS